MQRLNGKRLVIVVFTSIVALVLSGAAYIASANGGGGGGDAAPVPNSAVQGTPFALDPAGFAADEFVALTFTFPDGSVRDLQNIVAMDGALHVSKTMVPNPFNVDPVNLYLRSTLGGALHFVYTPTTSWPTGAYTATFHGLVSNQVVNISFAITAANVPIATPGVNLVVEDAIGNPQGYPGDRSTMSGNGFGANETIEITVIKPDGTREAFPYQPTTSLAGAFTVNFTFSAQRTIGAYTFIATSQNTNYIGVAQFDLLPPTPPTPTGSNLNVLVQADTPAPGSTRVEIQGSLFWANEGVQLYLQTPAGAPTYGKVYPLGPQFTDRNGQFAVAIVLDQSYPTGQYTVVATGSASGIEDSADFTP